MVKEGIPETLVISAILVTLASIVGVLLGFEKKLKKKVIKEVALKNELKPEEVESILEKIQKTVMPSPVIDSVSSETEANYIVPDIIVTVNPIDQSINVRVFD
ncbi:MAG TPA: hypothetical protein PLK34_01840, partial [Candidatus Pacearchaeota archaeon]|nr:hypothetical protein [Candidatus Pacearchaeota archaeon]